MKAFTDTKPADKFFHTEEWSEATVRWAQHFHAVLDWPVTVPHYISFHQLFKSYYIVSK